MWFLFYKRIMKKTLQELHHEFMEEYEFVAKRSPATLYGYRQVFKMFIKLLPSVTLENVTTETVKEFFRLLETRKRQVGKKFICTGIKPATAHTYRNKLSVFFDWLVIRKHVKENPFKFMPIPRIEPDTIKYLRKDKIERIYAGINFNINWPNNFIRKRNDIIISLCLCCGLRRKEMLGLSLNDIGLKRKVLAVRPKVSKTRRGREIPINSFLLQRLIDYLEERRKYNYKTHYLVMSGAKDNQLTVHGLKHIITKLVDETGVRFYLHQMRHTFAVNYLLNTNDVIRLKQLMGHCDIRMTARLHCLFVH
jgi:site-specific recombinase XerD